MRRIACLMLPLAAAMLVGTSASADADGHVNFFLGQKILDSGDWAPIDHQVEFGAVMSFGRDDWPVHIAVDVLGSYDEQVVFVSGFGNATFSGSTFEADAGVRKIWKTGKTKACMPYLGAGIGIIGAAAKIDGGIVSVDASDGAIGFWAGGGVFWRLGKRFNIGVDARYSTADVDLDFGGGMSANKVAAGGLHYGLLLGFGW
jgi:hypothetical protein